MPSMVACKHCSFATAGVSRRNVLCGSLWNPSSLLTPTPKPLAACLSLASKRSLCSGPISEKLPAQEDSFFRITHCSELSFKYHTRCSPNLIDCIHRPKTLTKSDTALLVRSSSEKLGDGVFIERASDSNVGAGALKGTLTTTKKNPPKQKGGKLPDRKEAVQTYVFDTPVQEQSPRVQATKRGRGGKTVTVVGSLKLKPESLEALAKQLKALCGAGGAVKEGCVEIQGDHTKSINEKLISLGYKSKVSGK